MTWCSCGTSAVAARHTLGANCSVPRGWEGPAHGTSELWRLARSSGDNIEFNPAQDLFPLSFEHLPRC